MLFLGQRTIMRELALYLPKLYENPSSSMSFLLRAPSGWGKTRMAFMMCNYLTAGDYLYYLGDRFPREFTKRVVFVDEVHLAKTPEVLYPIIDSSKHVLVFATNEVAILPEALVNRCVNLFFEPYSMDELVEIAYLYLDSYHKIPSESVKYLVESSGNNPRVLRGLCTKINLIDPSTVPKDVDAFKIMLMELFGIKDGLDVLCNRYIDALRNVGGAASLSTLSSLLRLDQSSIQYFIEPVLLQKGLIQITSRGRILTR